jgi:hypothetical protein
MLDLHKHLNTMQKFIALLFVFAFGSAFAQKDRIIEYDLMGNETKKSNTRPINAFTEIKLGAAIPGGSFADSRTFDDHGYAQGGFNIQLGGAGYLNKFFALGGTIFLTSNRTDLGFLNDTFNDDLTSDDIPPPGSTDIQGGNWININIFGGGVLTLPITERFKFEIKGQAGLSILDTPEYRYVYEPLELEYRYNMRNTVGFGYIVGGALKISPNKRNAIVIGVDYTSIQFETNSLYTKESILFDRTEISGTQQRRLNNILISIGFAFAF